MRFSRLYDGEGGYQEQPAEDTKPQGDLTGSVPMAPSAPTAPSADPAPGPNTSPAPQGGASSPPIPPPPAIASSVPGIQGSEATGGVQGSFGQAGTGGFSKRFGAPAAWFKGGPSAGLAREAANRGRVGAGGDAAALSGGGEISPVLAGPSSGLEGGGKNDEEWQRILQAVMAKRFQQ